MPFILLVFLLGSLSLGAQTFYEPIAEFNANRSALERVYSLKESQEYYERMLHLYRAHQDSLQRIDFEKLSQSDRVDYLCFRNYLERETHFTEQEYAEYKELASVTDFAGVLYEFVRMRRSGQQPDAVLWAQRFHEVCEAV